MFRAGFPQSAPGQLWTIMHIQTLFMPSLYSTGDGGVLSHFTNIIGRLVLRPVLSASQACALALLNSEQL